MYLSRGLRPVNGRVSHTKAPLAEPPREQLAWLDPDDESPRAPAGGRGDVGGLVGIGAPARALDEAWRARGVGDQLVGEGLLLAHDLRAVRDGHQVGPERELLVALLGPLLARLLVAQAPAGQALEHALAPLLVLAGHHGGQAVVGLGAAGAREAVDGEHPLGTEDRLALALAGGAVLGLAGLEVG